MVERIRTYGLVRTKFWENHSRNEIGDDRFYWDMLISPDKVLKSGQSQKTFHHHCTAMLFTKPVAIGLQSALSNEIL